MTTSITQPAQTGIDLFMIAADRRRLHLIGTGVTEQDQHHALEAEEQTET